MATENMIRQVKHDDDDGRCDDLDDGDDDDDDDFNDSPSPSPSSICPIRSSIRSSVKSRRQSSIMTISESEFVHDMLNNSSIDDDELKMLDETLKCDKLFFDPNNKNNNKTTTTSRAGAGAGATTQNKGQSMIPQKSNRHRNSSPDLVALSSSNSIPVSNSNPDLTTLSSFDNLLSNNNEGSEKRQEYLALRKKQSKEQCKIRAKLMWKKVSSGLKVAAKLNSTLLSFNNTLRKGGPRKKDSSSLISSTSMTLVEEDVDELKREEEEEQGKKWTSSSFSDNDDDDDDDEDDNISINNNNNVSGGVTTNRRDVFLRQASVNVYGGEGFEIGEEMFAPKPSSYEDDDIDNKYDYDTDILEEKKSGDSTDCDCDNFNNNNDDNNDDDTTSLDEDDEEQIRSFSSLSIFGADGDGGSKQKNNRGEGFRRASLNIYGGDGFEVAKEDLFDSVYTDNGERQKEEDYDPWLFSETDAQGRRLDFKILGTSHDDVDCHPHVLSPIQMDRFQPHLPNSIRGESFWLKYSLVRDGASSLSLLQQVRGSPYTLFAMETVDGEVFGGFFANAWTVQSEEYFGRGESFLWKMKYPRGGGSIRETTTTTTNNNNSSNGNLGDSFSSLSEQVNREAELDIFKSEAYYCNNFYQMCTHDKIAAGGGACDFPKDFGNERGIYSPEDIGFGLLFKEGSMMEGSSSACLTYRSPPLSDLHKDGSKFEVVNLEVWGFTPCRTEKDARILEYKNMFFKRHAKAVK